MGAWCDCTWCATGAGGGGCGTATVSVTVLPSGSRPVGTDRDDAAHALVAGLVHPRGHQPHRDDVPGRLRVGLAEQVGLHEVDLAGRDPQHHDGVVLGAGAGRGLLTEHVPPVAVGGVDDPAPGPDALLVEGAHRRGDRHAAQVRHRVAAGRAATNIEPATAATSTAAAT